MSGRDLPVELIGLDRTDWERVADDPVTFAADRRLVLGVDKALLQSVAEQTMALFKRTGVTTHPWSGFLAVNRASDTIVGTCGFKSPPDAEGMVEIAYFTFPDFEGQGVASAMAAGLVERAGRSMGVRRLLAHTLPQTSASTRVLEKTGFQRVGEVVDPEDGRVWRWQYAKP